MLQILTRAQFCASVHRVRAASAIVRSHATDRGGESDQEFDSRVSCPLIIRGSYSATFSPNRDCYVHPGGEVSVRSLADLDGVSMKEVHKILDFKRMKCKIEAEKDENNEVQWTLSAFRNHISH
jgi:hypothetical protein